MRIALCSDIHGSLLALEAVLRDVEAQGGVDEHWILGDLVALGPDPVGVLERLKRLPNARYTRGNTDRYVFSGERPPPSPTDVQANPDILPVLIEMTGSFAWTQGALAATGWLEWLAELPLEQRAQLPDGTRLLGVHAAPGQDDGLGLYPDQSDAELEAALRDAQADLLCVGHTHQAMDRRVAAGRVVNLGSVSNPLAPDARASYVLLQADAWGYHVEQRRVDYDRDAVIAQLERLRHPGAAFIVRHLRGEVKPRHR